MRELVAFEKKFYAGNGLGTAWEETPRHIFLTWGKDTGRQ